ncbi:hypothetical protein [Achromobacter aegrifaciens]
MQIGESSSVPMNGRFDRTTYQAAQRGQLDAVALLKTLETTRNLACGAMSLLSLLKAHALPEAGLEASSAAMINHIQMEDLLSLCIESMGLLNQRIESLADHMVSRYEQEQAEE